MLAPVLVPLAGAVAYSRVHIGVHYPSDVAVGVAIGVACGVSLRKCCWRLGGERRDHRAGDVRARARA